VGLIGLYVYYRWIKFRKDAADLLLIARSGAFDRRYYLATYPDVAAAGVDPLLHYMDFGAAEWRKPSAGFDPTYYAGVYPEVGITGINPILHFVKYRNKEGRTSWPVLQHDEWTRARKKSPASSFQTQAPTPQRIVIYTAVIGGYDTLQPPPSLPGCDFVVFSDMGLTVEGWQVRPLNYFHHDPTRAARFVKLHPHVYFSEYDHSIWIDANISIRGDIRALFDSLTPASPVAIFIHPNRDCIYVEGIACNAFRKDDVEIIHRQLERYRLEGIPEKIGLWETNVLARRHNDDTCIALMTAWWKEMEVGSRRDQLSLPIVAQRLGADIAPLDAPGVSAHNHALFAFGPHSPCRNAADMPAPFGAAGPIQTSSHVSLPDTVTIDIGVCVHNSPDETKACLESVVKARRPHDRILVVDDASQPRTADILDRFAASHDNVHLVRHATNRGYTASANVILKESRADWTVLLNSDAVIPPRALTKLVAGGLQFERLGIVGPLSNAASWQSVPRVTDDGGTFLINQLPPGLDAEILDRLSEEMSDGVPLFTPLVNGFCFAVRRRLVELIGGFDEEYFPQGYGEEDDFCLRAGMSGYLCGVVTNAYVFHVKSASFTPTRRKPLAEAGGRALRIKHSPMRVQAAVETMRLNPRLASIRQALTDRLGEIDMNDTSLKMRKE